MISLTDWLIFFNEQSCSSIKSKAPCFLIFVKLLIISIFTIITKMIKTMQQIKYLYVKHQPNDNLSQLSWKFYSIKIFSYRKKRMTLISPFPRGSITSCQNLFSKICPLILWAACFAPKRQTFILLTYILQKDKWREIGLFFAWEIRWLIFKVCFNKSQLN